MKPVFSQVCWISSETNAEWDILRSLSLSLHSSARAFLFQYVVFKENVVFTDALSNPVRINFFGHYPSIILPGVRIPLIRRLTAIFLGSRMNVDV